MPPKRMSDILASSSIDARISSPLSTAEMNINSSEGPTLSIISAESHEMSKSGAGKSGEVGNSNGAGGTKRKRTTAAEPDSQDESKKSKTARNHNHASLYTPWTLLPLKQRKDVEKLQARKEGEKKGVEVVVFTKNQAVKSGIALLLRLLNARPAEGEVDDGKDAHTSVAEDKEEKTDAREEEQILVVSAQGEGTVKLVGIVDMARRIAAEAARGKHKTGKEARWYMYTVLSSVQMPLRENGSSDAGVERDAEESGEAMHVDTDDEDGAVKETHTSPAEKMKNVPVLSVWLTRKSMVGWKDAFGEEEMVVHNAAGS